MRRNAESEIINGGRTTLVIPNEVRDRGFAGTGLRADLDFGWRSASSAAIDACPHCLPSLQLWPRDLPKSLLLARLPFHHRRPLPSIRRHIKHEGKGRRRCHLDREP